MAKALVSIVMGNANDREAVKQTAQKLAEYRNKQAEQIAAASPAL